VRDNIKTHGAIQNAESIKRAGKREKLSIGDAAMPSLPVAGDKTQRGCWRQQTSLKTAFRSRSDSGLVLCGGQFSDV